MKLRIGWWNTHLSPPGRNISATDDHLAEVCNSLAHLSGPLDMDLICLGEVSAADITRLSSYFSAANVELVEFEGREGRHTFNMAVLYRPARFRLIGATFEFDVIAGRKSKIALRLTVEFPDGQISTLFVIHWTSRLREGADTQHRSHLAQSLRRRINDLLDDDETGKIIVLGDFNDEPYDLSLSKFLEASRDAHRVASKPRLLYNPFWRPLAPKEPYSGSSAPVSNTGSYYYRAGQVNRWYVFDQIVVSSAFIGKSEWHLDEANTFIVDASRGFFTNIENGGNFDHYPILASLERL